MADHAAEPTPLSEVIRKFEETLSNSPIKIDRSDLPPFRISPTCHPSSASYAAFELGTEHITLLCWTCNEPFLQLKLGN